MITANIATYRLALVIVVVALLLDKALRSTQLLLRCIAQSIVLVLTAAITTSSQAVIVRIIT